MPINDDKPVVTRKYAVFINSSGSTFTRSDRLMMINARREMRSKGKSQFILLRKTRINEEEDVDVNVGNRIAIALGSLEAGETLSDIGNILWYGRITNVTSDIFHQIDDAIGSVVAEEIGYFADEKPIIVGSYPFITPGKVYNAFIEDKFYGNKLVTNGVNSFRTSDFAECRPNKEFGITDKDKVWTLEDVIRDICDKFSMSVKMPWEADNVIIDAKYDSSKANLLRDYNLGYISSVSYTRQVAELETQRQADKDGNKAKYRILIDYNKPRSFDHFHGKTLAEALDSLIEKPLDYYFDPTYSTASIFGTLVVVNTSPSEITDVAPAAQKITFNSNDNTTNVNISEADDTFDTVIVRGDNILFSGTFGTWQWNSNDTLASDWSSSEELLYVAGGSDSTGVSQVETSEQKATAFRQQFSDVYTRFRFNPTSLDGADINALQVNLKPFSSNTTRIPFLPFVDMRLSTGQGVRTIPKVNYSWSFHQTPDKLNIRWSNELPMPQYSTLTAVISSEKGYKIKPFVIAMGQDVDQQTFFFDLMQEGGAGVETAQMSFYNGNTAGLKIQQKIPETAAWSNSELFDVFGTPQTNMSNTLWNMAGATPRNPNTSDYKFLTHWGTYLATVAGYSNQKLEIQKQRTDTDGNIISVTNPKIKIIEDDSLQLWFAHPGTVIGLANIVSTARIEYDSVGTGTDNYIVCLKPRVLADANSVLRDQPTIYRNDIPKAKEILEAASAWYFTEKRSLKYEEALMNYIETVKLGNMIAELMDGTTKHAINTCVYSIEYDAGSSNPRAIVSTALPEVPILTRLQNQSGVGKASQLAGSAGKTKEFVTPRVVTPVKQPVIGAVTGGAGGGVDTSINVYTIVRGQTLLPSGLYGIKRLADVPTTAPTWFITGGNAELLTYATFPDGLGLAQNIVDASYVKVANINNYSFLQGDAIKGNAYGVGGATVVVSGSSLTAAVYPLIYGR